MISENTLRDGSDAHWGGKNTYRTARRAPETAQYRLKPPRFAGRSAYPGSIPTITAFGVPHAALAPVWLLRQTIFIGLAGGGAG